MTLIFQNHGTTFSKAIVTNLFLQNFLILKFSVYDIESNFLSVIGNNFFSLKLSNLRCTAGFLILKELIQISRSKRLLKRLKVLIENCSF